MPEKFVQATHTTLLQRRQFNAIRRLCNSYPPQGAHGRLEKIADIATGAAKPEIEIQPLSVDLKERLEAGAASRSPRAGQAPKPEPEKVDEPEPTREPEDETPDGDESEDGEGKRKAKKGRDRKEGRGFNRTTDINV
jgi:hypothetical protein